MNSTMKAVGYRTPLPIEAPESLLDVDIPVPIPGPHDLLIAPAAVSVNPVDVKLRAGSPPADDLRILGFDASGTVVGVGDAVSLFAVGDDVFYAGSIDRPGSNAALQAVDERIVGRKPASLSHAEAAAMPLTAITAWESLFHRLRLERASKGSIVVVGAAGGVGSVLIQLARQLTDLTIIATASRPESAEWVREMGAHHVIDHREDMVKQVEAIVPGGVDYLFTSQTGRNIPAFAEMVRPFGEIVAIDDPAVTDVNPLKWRSITWHWELMFTRPVHQTPDMIEQHRLLTEVSSMLDMGTLRTTLSTTIEGIDAAHLREAHQLVESGRTIGKVVLTRT